MGIPLDQKQKIFEKGYGRHTGFGLFLAREILAITGISIHETGVHMKGARFEIAVPKGGYRRGGGDGGGNPGSSFRPTSGFLSAAVQQRTMYHREWSSGY